MGSTVRRLARIGAYFLQACLANFDRTIRMMGPMMVVIASVLISGVIYAWYHSVLPALGLGPVMQLVMAVFGLFLVVNIVFNYGMAVRTKPGAPPNDAEAAESLLPAGQQRESGAPKWCKKCRQPKPPRAHHCSVCGKCVLKMDHHCPWVAGCVGYFNYRYFFLFLLYLWVGCVYVWSTSLGLFLHATKLSQHTVHEVEITFAFVLTIAVTLALGVLLAWHIYLICSGQTTIEYYENRSKPGDSIFNLHANHTWDLGMRMNLQCALGVQGCPENVLWWFLPTTTPVAGDGLSFDDRWQMVRKRQQNRPLIIADPGLQEV